jgi:hypothetical protein
MSQVAFLVSSFDRHEACWEPFCHGLKKYWPEHFQPLYFITNEKDPPCGEAIKVGTDKGWGENLRLALELIPQEFILYSHEDYWIEERVDAEAILQYLQLLESDQADYIRLYPAPPPSQVFPGDERLGILSAEAEYRTSLQMALWRKSTLQALLKTGESPWQFEIAGNIRSREYGERFLCIRKRSFGVHYVFTAIVDGEWSPLAFEYAKREGIEVRFSDLPLKPLARRLKDRTRRLLYELAFKIRRSHRPG